MLGSPWPSRLATGDVITGDMGIRCPMRSVEAYMGRLGCTAGLEALAAYHEKRDEQRAIGLGPAHDWSSHGSDAFGLMAIQP